MNTASRLALSASALLGAALLVVGCASGGQQPASSADPDDSNSAPAPASGDDFEAAWLDDGRMFAIVSWGSSTCIPMVEDVTADGQTVTVTLTEAASGDAEGGDGGDTEQACTADLVARASIGALPEGVDPTKDVEFTVTLGDMTDDAELDGNPALTGGPGEQTEYTPSAGWFDDEGIVLLTWGSSSCPPIVEGVEEQAGGATVTFKTEDRMCTMDMAPRATVIGLSGDVDDDDEFTLTLVGDNLDGTVNVLRG
ncbi:hypothetical protein [Microbacterium aerolatum]|uniref:Lipoprotein n=1 Tax=Microbacterium aerolatum TaxID=153731 RepID=A0A511ABS3_9MICO|nr:hypothetical protein [Microbacterium aerolatum]GEK85456.1 hypothetical protein MAE01_06320 [Microbacterium aerolatum]GGB31222.1 hypothetical protein GCM10007198_22130 [Microbacterium aerolatum]